MESEGYIFYPTSYEGRITIFCFVDFHSTVSHLKIGATRGIWPKNDAKEQEKEKEKEKKEKEQEKKEKGKIRIFSPKFPFRANQKNLLLHKKLKFYLTTYGSCEDSSHPHETKNRVSKVICVENDAKLDARCHTLKIDLRYLKCTKIDAKGKKKEKEEKFGMNLLKSPFFDDRKNRLHNEEIKLSNKRYGSYGVSSHSHDTKNLTSEC